MRMGFCPRNISFYKSTKLISHFILRKKQAAFGVLSEMRLSVSHLRLPLNRHKKFANLITVFIIAFILGLSSNCFAQGGWFGTSLRQLNDTDASVDPSDGDVIIYDDTTELWTPESLDASDASTDTTNFDNNLSGADTTIQAALETLDELATGGNTAWDDITNPDAADEIDFGSHVTELNVEDFRIGDGGSNYVKFSGAGAITLAGTASITGNITGNADTVTTNANLTGEVTSAGNVATIADSVTVTGWVLGTSSATQFTSPTLITNLIDTTGAADMDYGSIDVTDHTFITDGTGTAEIVLPAGSIDGTEILDDTVDSADYAAGSIDAEHLAADIVTHALMADSDQADTKCFYFEDPTAADDFKSIWANKTANDFLITEIWAESDQTVTFMLQVDDGSPADVDTVDLAPAAGEAEDTSLDGDTTVAAGEELDLDLVSVANTPTWCSICFTGNWVD